MFYSVNGTRTVLHIDQLLKKQIGELYISDLIKGNLSPQATSAVRKSDFCYSHCSFRIWQAPAISNIPPKYVSLKGAFPQDPCQSPLISTSLGTSQRGSDNLKFVCWFVCVFILYA